MTRTLQNVAEVTPLIAHGDDFLLALAVEAKPLKRLVVVHLALGKRWRRGPVNAVSALVLALHEEVDSDGANKAEDREPEGDAVTEAEARRVLGSVDLKKARSLSAQAHRLSRRRENLQTFDAMMPPEFPKVKTMPIAVACEKRCIS